jgi:hypothetical protein
LTFTPPPGWSIKQSNGDRVTIEHYSIKRETSKITLLSKPTQRGPIAEALRQAVRNELRSDLKLYGVESGKTVYGSPAAYFTIEFYNHPQTNETMVAAGVAFDIGDRMRIALLTTVAGKEYNDREGELDEMVRTFRFQSLSSAPAWDVLNPQKGSGGLEGLYWGWETSGYFGAGGYYQTSLNNVYSVFFPKGQYYDGLPGEGRVLDLDFAEALRTQRKRCGIYRLDGANLVIEKLTKFDVIKQEVIPLKRQNANSVTFSRPPEMKRYFPAGNIRLSGKYTYAFRTISNIPVAIYIEFTPDGRYLKSGFTSSTLSQLSLDAVRAQERTVAGRYAVSGFRLTLTPDNGAPEYFTIMPENPSSPNPTQLYINDKLFEKK